MNYKNRIDGLEKRLEIVKPTDPLPDWNEALTRIRAMTPGQIRRVKDADTRRRIELVKSGRLA